MESAPTDETWSLPIAWVGFVVLMVLIMAGAGVSILTQTLAGRPGPPLFAIVLWFGALGWVAYWWLFRVAYRVDLVDGVLTWRAPFGSGRLPVTAIERVGRWFGAPYTCALRAGGHRTVIVFTQLRSFDPMLAAMNRINSAVPPGQ